VAAAGCPVIATGVIVAVLCVAEGERSATKLVQVRLPLMLLPLLRGLPLLLDLHLHLQRLLLLQVPLLLPLLLLLLGVNAGLGELIVGRIELRFPIGNERSAPTPTNNIRVLLNWPGVLSAAGTAVVVYRNVPANYCCSSQTWTPGQHSRTRVLFVGVGTDNLLSILLRHTTSALALSNMTSPTLRRMAFSFRRAWSSCDELQRLEPEPSELEPFCSFFEGSAAGEALA
jgi:hypothetical protein